MTDLVSTDALRKIAGKHNNIDQLGHQMWELAARAAIDTAADEVDRLRADVKAAARMHEQARILADSALKQRDALRTVIENAPHGKWCDANYESTANTCTCWKASAL